ncbi:MAG: hypothetical protein AABM67_09565 [Acidobacteriota bacterium]
MTTKALLFLLLLFSVATLTTAWAFQSREQTIRWQQGRQTAETIDVSNFPIFDYAAQRQATPSEQVKREAKSKKYNNRHSAPITESSDQIYAILDWDVGLPALPLTKSSAIVLGEIVDAQAYLSEDLTQVYSEFVVRLNEVFKSDSNLRVGDSITVERLGGRVRVLSGKIVSSVVNHQDMPRVGGKYVLFLTHEFPKGGQYKTELFILTAYELRGNRVFPLDKPAPGHPILAYKGTSKESFMKDLETALRTTP